MENDDFIYRAMIEENGKPKLGISSTTLGIRSGTDIEVDSTGMVHRPTFQAGEKNGLSCSPTVETIPDFALPRALGGQHKSTEVWRIRKADLDPKLVAEQDDVEHISIGPSQSMAYDDYVRAIQATQDKWELVTSEMGDNNDF